MPELYELVLNFRKALDNAFLAGEFTHDEVFRNFPYGCCGDTCAMLGQYLISQGIVTEYVVGTWYGSDYRHQTHVWLEIESKLIIDITGDQFREQPEFYYFHHTVYVGNETSFHLLFEERKKGAWLPFNKLGCFEPQRLPQLYSKISEYLKKDICLEASVE